jgi:hypothetical protein
MEVGAELGQGVLRSLALEIAELVHSAPLEAGLGPDEPDRLPQPRMAVDHADHRGSETTGDKIVQAALPRLERLAAAELQRHELLLAVCQNSDDAEKQGCW